MVAEFVAFITVGYLIGPLWAVLLVVLASLAGLVLLRREGLRAWRRFREAATSGSATGAGSNAGNPPGPRVTDGLVGLGGALLLAVPGLVSGVVGALLLVPPVRRFARGRVQARAERWMSSAEAGQVFGPRRVRVHTNDVRTNDPAPEGEVVEGEIV